LTGLQIDDPSKMLRMASRLSAYLAIVTLGLGVGLIFSLRGTGVFACPAGDYAANRYIAYCGSSHYGDYDHGAFWFNLEPAAQRAASNADVLVLGNSRIQAALSSGATDEWFSANSRSFFLLGFMYDDGMTFSGEILEKLKPKARFYVINLDHFFRSGRSEPAQFIATDGEARSQYQAKRRWQAVHRRLCGKISALCGKKEAWFRSTDTGAYMIRSHGLIPAAVEDDTRLDGQEIRDQVANASPFLAKLGVPRSCIVFTMVPYKDTPVAAAAEIATALGIPLVMPRLDGLTTFDGSHLDSASAERWSAEFLRLAGPLLAGCLDAAGPAK
jgi:hypothetical protein